MATMPLSTWTLKIFDNVLFLLTHVTLFVQATSTAELALCIERTSAPLLHKAIVHHVHEG